MSELRGIPGHPGYAVSDSGQVWSLPRRSRRTPRLLQPDCSDNKYARVSLYSSGRGVHKSVYRLVLEAFVGPCPDGMEACHNNGDSFDNRLENLRWDTRSANNLDAVRHGTASGLLSRTPGEKCGRAKLRELDVRRMRYLRRAGVKLADLATVFGISASQAGYICSGKSWSHI